MTIKPWHSIDPRTNRPWHWSYNPNIGFGVGTCIGAIIVILAEKL